MFVGLMASATWVQYFQADRLNNDSRNVRTLYREFGNARGPIVVAGEADRAVHPVEDSYGYQRVVHRTASCTPPMTGFYSVVNGRTELERAANEELTGRGDRLFFSRIRDLLTGRQPEGAAVETTINPAAQQAAFDGLGRPAGRRRRARAVDRQDPRAGLDARLRPERARVARHRGRERRVPGADAGAGQPAAQQRDAGDLPARVDVQAGHGGGGPRERRSTRPRARCPRPSGSRCRRPTATIGNFGGGRLRRRPDHAWPTRCASPATPRSRSSGMDVGADALRDAGGAVRVQRPRPDDPDAGRRERVPRGHGRCPSRPSRPSASATCGRRRCRWRWSPRRSRTAAS